MEDNKNIDTLNDANKNNAIEKKDNEIIAWIRKNKKIIFFYIGSIGISGIVGYLVRGDSSKEIVNTITKELSNIKEELKNAKLKISELEYSNWLKDFRIMDLEKMCEEKDKVMDKVMSDGLRYRSPEAARQMRFKQDYLKKH